MQLFVDNLGKVAITIEEGYWSNDKDYDKLTVVEKEGVFGTFISRKPVPAGTVLTDRRYWIPFSSLKEEIVLQFNAIVNELRNLEISVDEKEAEIYKAMASIVAGGVALKQSFGDSEVFGISQKVLTESRDNLQAQINEIVSGGATLNLYVSPTVVFVGVQRSISVTATSDTDASSIKIFKNGTENPISSGSDRMLPAIDTVTPSARGNIQYYAEFVISGLTKRYPASENDFVNVQAVDECYTGAGTIYNSGALVAETSPHAAGSFNKQITTADGDYLFIEVPDNFNLTSIKLVSTYETSLGFTQIESTRAGYKAYKNNDARGAGTYTYKFTIANA